MERIYQKFPMIKGLEKKSRLQFEDYFSSAPDWVADACRLVELKKNEILVKENMPADTVYFVFSGNVKAVDYRIFGMAYDFMHFSDIYAFGGLEVLTKDKFYQTTLEAATDCIAIKLPRTVYEKWLAMDSRVLELEAGNVAKYLLEQGKSSRAFLFLQGADRLLYILLDMYERQQKDVLKVNLSQTELAELSGICVKTVYRSMKTFEKNDWVTREGKRFTMNRAQYDKCEEYMSHFVLR